MKSNTWIMCATLAWGLAMLGCAGPGQQPQKAVTPIASGELFEARATQLWELDAGVTDVRFSANGASIAWIVAKDNKQWVVHDGSAGAAYDEIPSWSVVLSPDGNRAAYPARKGASWAMVIDGKEGDTSPITPGVARFSPDGSHVGYTAKPEPRREAMVMDGQRGPDYDIIGLLVFSPDSKHTAYTAVKQGEEFMIVDGKESEEFKNLEDPRAIFTPGGRRVIQSGGNEGISWSIDGRPGKAYQGLGMPVLSPDGKHVAYWAMRHESGRLNGRVVLDGKEGPAFDGTGEFPGLHGDAMTFSEDSKHFAYVGRRGKIRAGALWAVVSDAKELGSYEDVGQIVYSPDGTRLAYAVEQKGMWAVVLDGKMEPAFDAVRDIRFSRDGQSHTYQAKRHGQWTVVIDGQAGGAYDHLGPSRINSAGEVEGLAVKDGHVWRVAWSKR
ncbi:MAG: hypothetical protein WD042_09040 [Phycisphaeraceae bacterium]